MGRAMPIPQTERPVFIILLAQGGEFGFVVFQTATQAGVITAPVSSFLIAAVTISMLLTPLLLVAADRWWIPILAGQARRDGVEEISEPQNGTVIIAGFGRYGQIVGRLLFANGISADRARPRRRGDRGAAQVRLARSTTATRPGST